jgi:hypothetical protein
MLGKRFRFSYFKMNAYRSVVVLAVLLCVFGCGHTRQDAPIVATPKTVWVDPDELRQSPVQHDHLTDGQMRRINALQHTFHEVDPSSLDKWVEGFKRDRDPEREIRIYEGMAEAYSAYCSGKSLTPKAKLDVYQVVLLRSGATDAEVISRLNLKVLTKADARDILKQYKMAPTPIRISTQGG